MLALVASFETGYAMGSRSAINSSEICSRQILELPVSRVGSRRAEAMSTSHAGDVSALDARQALP